MPRVINREAPFQPVSGAARITGLSRGYIRDGCRSGTIPHIHVGSDIRVNMPVWRAQLDAESLKIEQGGDRSE